MTNEEICNRVQQLRKASRSSLKNKTSHFRLMDQAFEELKEVHKGEPDISYEKIEELDA